ncbi:MAG: hypothetical protein ISR47_03685 [Rhodospirillales bacterium]|nr:hypothetical protein [Rhodospirillales bacterium]
MIRLLPVLIALSCCLPPPAWAEQKYESHLFGSNFCDRSPDEPIFIGQERPETLPEFNFSKPVPEMLTDKLPLERIRSATYPDGGSTERDHAWLVLVTLMVHEKIAAYYREFLIKEGASDTLLAVFDKAAAWREDICAREPTDAYLHYKKLYDHQSGDPLAGDYFAQVARRISRISFTRFSPVAYHDGAMHRFYEPESKEETCGSRGILDRNLMRISAALNHLPAIRKMIGRSLALGNRAEAYFWMQRAKRLGLDVENNLQALKPKLTKLDRSYLARWKPDKDISSLGKAFHSKDFYRFMIDYPNYWSEKYILCPDHRAN